MNWENLFIGIGGVLIGAGMQYYFNKKQIKYNILTEKQFEMYQDFWEELVSLKKIMQILWDNPQIKNLFHFSQKIKMLLTELEEKRLILYEKEYKKLETILLTIFNYLNSKRKLIDIYSESNTKKDEIIKIIEDNKKYKEEYEKLLEDIYKEFRKKLNIEN